MRGAFLGWTDSCVSAAVWFCFSSQEFIVEFHNKALEEREGRKEEGGGVAAAAVHSTLLFSVQFVTDTAPCSLRARGLFAPPPHFRNEPTHYLVFDRKYFQRISLGNVPVLVQTKVEIIRTGYSISDV